MTDDKWIYLDKRSQKLVLRFRVKGHSKQFFLASGLPDNQDNRAILRLRVKAIETDILLDRFDATLESYHLKKRVKPKPKPKLTLIDVWEKFSLYQETQIEQTTILGRYETINKFLKRKLPTTQLKDAVVIRNYMITQLSKTTAWIYLGYLSQACAWAEKNELIESNPFAKLKIKKPKSPKQHDAYTIDQRDLIIKTFETSVSGRHYANLIKFLFYTGCRPGEAFALMWDDISPDCRQIRINKSCNFKRIQKGTKNGKTRTFPVAEGSKLHQLLLSMERRPGLIFKNKRGNKIITETLGKEWKNKWDKETDSKTQLEAHNVPYMRIYSTRHTFATCAIASGVKPILVAKWLGDTLDTVLKYYTHPEGLDGDCPDF